MTTVLRPPRATLRPFVRALWVSDRLGAPAEPGVREHAIPTGEMHIVIRLSDAPVRLFAGDDDCHGRSVGHAVVAGPRPVFHVKDASSPFYSVGVQLHPSISSALFGVPADRLAERHVALDDVWGDTAARDLRERLLEARDPRSQLDSLEQALAARLPLVQGMHPAVAMALERFRVMSAVAPVVAESGYSHRAFIAMFRRTMGMTPKRYLRLMRVRRVLGRIGREPMAALALDAGFSDQAHFVREFQAITGVTPSYYRRVRSAAASHVKIVQDAGRGGH